MTSTFEYRVMIKLKDSDVWGEWLGEAVGVTESRLPELNKIVKNLRRTTTWEVRLERRRVMRTSWREVEE